MQNVGERHVFELVCDMIRGVRRRLVVDLTNAGDVARAHSRIFRSDSRLGAQDVISRIEGGEPSAPALIQCLARNAYASGESFCGEGGALVEMIAGNVTGGLITRSEVNVRP